MEETAADSRKRSCSDCAEWKTIVLTPIGTVRCEAVAVLERAFAPDRVAVTEHLRGRD